MIFEKSIVRISGDHLGVISRCNVRSGGIIHAYEVIFNHKSGSLITLIQNDDDTTINEAENISDEEKQSVLALLEIGMHTF